MTEQQALLRAIAANPLDRLPRLVYADWLDEFGESDLDAATSEYIRIYCRNRKEAKTWLLSNYLRLIPLIRNGRGSGWNCQGGRSVEGGRGRFDMSFMRVQRRTPTSRGHLSFAWIGLFFGGGFLLRYSTKVPDLGRFVEPLIAADQPLCKLRFDKKRGLFTASAAASPADGSTSSGSNPDPGPAQLSE